MYTCSLQGQRCLDMDPHQTQCVTSRLSTHIAIYKLASFNLKILGLFGHKRLPLLIGSNRCASNKSCNSIIIIKMYRSRRYLQVPCLTCNAMFIAVKLLQNPWEKIFPSSKNMLQSHFTYDRFVIMIR